MKWETNGWIANYSDGIEAKRSIAGSIGTAVFEDAITALEGRGVADFWQGVPVSFFPHWVGG